MCKYANMQVCKCASMQMCKYANVQVCNCASMQMFNYANVQVCKCANVLICKYANLHVCQPVQSLNVCQFFRVSTRLMAIGLVSYMISHFVFQTGKYSMEIELEFRAPSPTINCKAFP